jgi:hypothetical protein
MAERGTNSSIDWAVTEPAASRMLEAVRAVRRLKNMVTRRERRGFERVCKRTKYRVRHSRSGDEIEEPGTTCVTLGIFLERKKCR